MIGRNRRNRQASMKARLGIATAVLLGGGAVGVAAVAAGNHGPATTSAQSAGFIMSFHHRISEQAALSSAISTWGASQQRSLAVLAQMAPMRTFSQVWHRHTMFAAQRGVVVLATRRFLLVKSANGSLHLWWLTGGTKFKNVSASPAGLTAMTGNNRAAVQAMVNQNMAPAAAAMAGSTAVVNQMAAPVAKPTTITVDTGTQVITITITSTTATVTQPVTQPVTTATTGAPTATPSATPTMMGMPTAKPTTTVTPVATPTPSATATQPTFTATQGVARGDLVFIAGVRTHGRLIAKLVLFAAPAMTTPTPTASPTGVVTATVPATPSATPSVTGTSAPTFSGHNS